LERLGELVFDRPYNWLRAVIPANILAFAGGFNLYRSIDALFVVASLPDVCVGLHVPRRIYTAVHVNIDTDAPLFFTATATLTPSRLNRGAVTYKAMPHEA
jgi:hypothetical protein